MKLALYHNLKEGGAEGLAPPSRAGGKRLELCRVHISFLQMSIFLYYKPDFQVAVAVKLD